MNEKEKIKKIIECLNKGMYEREEIIAVSLLAALAGEGVFLLGPPGTAKSLIARRIACAFADKKFFSYLMNKFSTPEEIFGPISIKALKEDKYFRKTENFLPTADFAFLDEIWKAGPAILNTLLTIINERIFRNGTEENKVPLKALIAASNETPPEGQGLEALYDRFIVRLHVPPMLENENFEKLLNAEPTLADIELTGGLAITNHEWDEWRELIQEIELSDETINVVKLIKQALIGKEKKKSKKDNKDDKGIYVSDRRWQKAMVLLKAAAFFCDRNKTNLADTLLLHHCLWTSEENREDVVKIVKKAVLNCGFETGKNISGLIGEKDKLAKEINKELYYSEDIYDTVNIGGKKHLEEELIFCTDTYGNNKSSDYSFYIPYSKMKTKGEFNPVDEQGNPIEKLICDFKGQGTCSIYIKNDYINIEGINYDHIWLEHIKEASKCVICSFVISLHKGDKKEDVNHRLIEALKKSVFDIREGFTGAQIEIEERLNELHSELETPFVPEDVCDIAVESINKQLDEVKIAIQDCERLDEIVGKV